MKTIMTITALLVCVLVMDFGVGKVFDSLMYRMSNEGDKVARSNYAINTVNSEIIIVGSSRAECHYNSRMMQDANLGGAVYNCGVDGSLFFYHITVINSILNRYTPKVIIWDMQLWDLEKDKQPENLGLLYPYYWKNEYIRKLLNEQEPDLKFKIWLNVYRYNATGSRILRSLRSSQSNQLGFLSLSSNASLNKVDTKTSGLKQLPLEERKIQLFEETIQRFVSSGVRIVIAHSPYCDEYKGKTSTTACIEETCSKYGVEFINDSQLPEFVGRTEYVYDAVHLNGEGANLFTSILIKQLNHDN